jgi:uncharacterized membrane protein
MKSIKQLLLLYALPFLLSMVALILSVVNGRTLYAVLSVLLLIAVLSTLQLFTTKVKRAVDAALERAAESATLAGALFSTLWTTFGAALLITIRRH